MTARGVIYLVLAVMAGIFVLANLSALMTSLELHVLFARVQLPVIALLMLLLGLVIGIELLLQLFANRGWAKERLALGRRLEEALLRAEKEEESRMAALRATLESELGGLKRQLAELIAGQQVLLDHQVPEARELDAHGNRVLPPPPW